MRERGDVGHVGERGQRNSFETTSASCSGILGRNQITHSLSETLSCSLSSGEGNCWLRSCAEPRDTVASDEARFPCFSGQPNCFCLDRVKEFPRHVALEATPWQVYTGWNHLGKHGVRGDSSLPFAVALPRVPLRRWNVLTTVLLEQGLDCLRATWT